MISYSGIGSWNGTDLREAQKIVRDVLLDGGIPYLVEVPRLGPGAGMIGRTAAMLVELGAEYVHDQWQLSSTPDTQFHLARAFLGEGLDLVAELFEGYEGPLKVQATGPWTLAAWLRLRTGESVLSDAGAWAEVTESLLEGVSAHIADVHRLVPGAEIMLQLDEPSLPAVLAGQIPNRTKLWRYPAVPAEQALATLRRFPVAVLHCCATPTPLDVLSWAPAVAADVRDWNEPMWEQARDTVTTLWAGGAGADVLVHEWPGDVVVTSPCGLAYADAPRALQRCRDVAHELEDRR